MDSLWATLEKQGPLVVVLLFFLWGFVRGDPWWVTGREYREKAQDCEEYKDLALSLLQTAEKAVTKS